MKKHTVKQKITNCLIGGGAILILGAAVTAGVVKATVSDKLDQNEVDHTAIATKINTINEEGTKVSRKNQEQIAVINNKLDNILEDQKEIKSDVKCILLGLESKVTSNEQPALTLPGYIQKVPN